MTALPSLHLALDVEMIRDGGSFAAFFEDKDGYRHMLLTRIKVVDRDELTVERVGYEQPVLIDCEPSKRPLDTRGAELPEVLVTWDQARIFMALTKRIADGLDDQCREWLKCMDYVVANDGSMPPSMEARPQTVVHKS